jgi:hypothetical protein
VLIVELASLSLYFDRGKESSKSFLLLWRDTELSKDFLDPLLERIWTY